MQVNAATLLHEKLQRKYNSHSTERACLGELRKWLGQSVSWPANVPGPYRSFPETISRLSQGYTESFPRPYGGFPEATIPRLSRGHVADANLVRCTLREVGTGLRYCFRRPTRNGWSKMEESQLSAINLTNNPRQLKVTVHLAFLTISPFLPPSTPYNVGSVVSALKVSPLKQHCMGGGGGGEEEEEGQVWEDEPLSSLNRGR